MKQCAPRSVAAGEDGRVAAGPGAAAPAAALGGKRRDNPCASLRCRIREPSTPALEPIRSLNLLLKMELKLFGGRRVISTKPSKPALQRPEMYPGGFYEPRKMLTRISIEALLVTVDS